MRSRTFLVTAIIIILIILVKATYLTDSKINIAGDFIRITTVPFNKGIFYATKKTQDFFGYFKRIDIIVTENKQLKKKSSMLEKENLLLQEYKLKVNELKDVLNIKEQLPQYELIPAELIANDSGNWFNVFLIDKGSKDGILPNYIIINNKGLVGKVIATDVVSSKVISINDEDSAVSARISKNRELVVVKGDVTLKTQGLCRVDYIPLDADIIAGDTIETSGDGGVFPKGIIIGKVKEVRQVGNDLTKYAIIEPVIDYGKLEEVYVLKPK